MNNFIIKETNMESYNRFLLWLSFESLIYHFEEIEKDPMILHSSGKILIDQLLITGNGDNRFICCNFENGKLNFKTAEIVLPTDYFRKETVQWLHDNYSYVKYSILTDNQRRKIENKIAF